MFHQCKTKQKIHPEWAFLNVRQKIKLKSLLWAHRQYHVTSAFYLIRYTTQSYYLQFWHQPTSLCRWYTNLDVCIRYRHEYLKPIIRFDSLHQCFLPYTLHHSELLSPVLTSTDIFMPMIISWYHPIFTFNMVGCIKRIYLSKWFAL